MDSYIHGSAHVLPQRAPRAEFYIWLSTDSLCIARHLPASPFSQKFEPRDLRIQKGDYISAPLVEFTLMLVPGIL